jgi:Zn-dependent protease
MITKAGSYRLFSAFGIEVFVHWTWFIAAYILYSWSNMPFAVFMSVYVSLFGIVLLHEFGHALACRSVGGKANLIVLWPLGGVAYVAPPARPGAVLWSIAAGPLVNVVLVPILGGLLLAVDALGETSTAAMLQRYLSVLFNINLVLLIFNMLPIYPLDGGQILQSILWFFIGRAKSLRATSVIGIIAAGIGLVWALTRQDWFMVAIAAFIGWQAFKGFAIANVMAKQEAHEHQSIQRALQRAREMAGRP